MIPLNLRDVYRASHVRRWHVVNVHRQQSLAEHMWLVAMTAYELAKRLGVQHPTRAPLSMDELMYAMEHDLAEVRYGDIPTPGKRMLRAIGANLNTLEMQLTEKPMNYDPNGEISSLGLDVIKLADMFEGVFFIEENGYGRHAAAVAHDARAKLNDMVKSMSVRWVGLSWHNVVNTMLADVGSLPLQPLYGE